MASSGGGHVIIANGTNRTVLDQIRQARRSDLVSGAGEPVPAWKRWIGYTVTPSSKLRIDRRRYPGSAGQRTVVAGDWSHRNRRALFQR